MDKFRKQTGKHWEDVSGIPVDVKRLTREEKLNETEAVKIINAAIMAERTLKELKRVANEGIEKSLGMLMEGEEGSGKNKSHSFYSFNKSIKIRRDVVDIYEYEDARMILAYEKFKAWLDEQNVDNAALKKIILSAFKISRGRYDNKKVAPLLVHKDDPVLKKDKLFQAAIKLLEKAKTITGVKAYDRFSVKLNDGKWQQIQLQFTGIDGDPEVDE